MRKRHWPIGLALAVACLLATPLAAQQFEQIGPYQIHYSAVSTSFLPEAVAREHRIQRSPHMALLNVSVIETRADGSTRAVPAGVDGSVGGLSGAERTPLSFRTLRQGETLSQIALFRIHEGEPMRFDLAVRYDRNAEPARIGFIQRFYLDR